LSGGGGINEIRIHQDDSECQSSAAFFRKLPMNLRSSRDRQLSARSLESVLRRMMSIYRWIAEQIHTVQRFRVWPYT
jgi:lambda repressor-like predicted transcriptional regulator